MENLIKLDLKMHKQCDTRYWKHCCTGSQRDIQKCITEQLFYVLICFYIFFCCCCLFCFYVQKFWILEFRRNPLYILIECRLVYIYFTNGILIYRCYCPWIIYIPLQKILSWIYLCTLHNLTNSVTC